MGGPRPRYMQERPVKSIMDIESFECYQTQKKVGQKGPYFQIKLH